MKKYLLFFTFISITAYSQIPNGYYTNATGTGYTLKTQLYNIIRSGHVDHGYDNLYNGYEKTDTDSYYENDGTILDMYSENPSGTDPYNYTHHSNNCGNYSSESDCYNREHLFPQGTFDKKSPMRNDIHHVVPSDGKVNGQRSNYPFGEVSSPSWTSLNGSKRGANTTSGYSGTVFEPIDEFKGDIARCMLYFATRYETQIDGWSHAMTNGTENQAYADWFITLLVKWHANDPVSPREINRNNEAYNYQGNRNPYIDHPEYVNIIWSAFSVNPDTEVPSTPLNLIASNITNTTVDLNWTASTDNIGVNKYEVYNSGTLLASSNTNSTTLTNLTQNTSYSLTVKALDAVGNKSSASNLISVTTTNIIDSEAPSAITDLNATNTTSNSTELFWTASTDNQAVTSYEIYKDAIFLASSNTNTYNVSSLNSETTYNFTVYAKDAANNTSVISNTKSVLTLAGPIAGTECGTETFTDLGSSASSYKTYNWTGDNNVQWTATDSRNDLTLDGRSIAVRNGSLTSSTISNGISELTITTQRAYSGGSGTFNVKINGTIVGTVPYDDTVQTTTISGFNIQGDITISFEDHSSASNRVKFDNLTWNCYSSSLSTDKFVNNLFTIYPK